MADNNTNYFDFDAYMKERKGDPYIVRAFGKEYEIPSDVPFEIVLQVSRSFKEGQDEMSEDQTLEIAEQLFGKENFKEWREKGIGLSGVMVMIERVLSMYMEQTQDQAKEVNQGNPR